jgi:hypothetical protein
LKAQPYTERQMDHTETDCEICTGFNWLSIGSRNGSCEHGTEGLVSIKGGKFLNQLNDYQLLKKDSASWSYLVGGSIMLCSGWTFVSVFRLS